jgi:hypothetical protein
VVEAPPGLAGIAVPHDVVVRKPVQRWAFHHCIDRHAVTAGGVLDTAQVLVQHRGVERVPHIRRDAVEIAQLRRVLGDQPIALRLAKRRPPGADFVGAGTERDHSRRRGFLRIDTDRVWHGGAYVSTGNSKVLSLPCLKALRCPAKHWIWCSHRRK